MWYSRTHMQAFWIAHSRTPPQSASSKLIACAPRRAVAVGEVGAEGLEGLGARAEVVVDDVEDHPEPARVGGVDQRRSPSGPP